MWHGITRDKQKSDNPSHQLRQTVRSHTTDSAQGTQESGLLFGGAFQTNIRNVTALNAARNGYRDFIFSRRFPPLLMRVIHWQLHYRGDSFLSSPFQSLCLNV
jgi:hypothetical protein